MSVTASVEKSELAAANAPSMGEDLQAVAQRSQLLVEQSIQRFPGLSVGAAIAAGVVLGCLVKRN